MATNLFHLNTALCVTNLVHLIILALVVCLFLSITDNQFVQRMFFVLIVHIMKSLLKVCHHVFLVILINL